MIQAIEEVSLKPHSQNKNSIQEETLEYLAIELFEETSPEAKGPSVSTEHYHFRKQT